MVDSVDNSYTRSRHARKIVKGWRKGLYYPHVDFHVTEVDKFLAHENQSQNRNPEERFDHIILDLPSPQQNFAAASEALRIDGSLLVWVPSVTQIIDAMKFVKEQNLPLWLDRVVEMGQGLTAGRTWDVRWTRIRSVDRKREKRGAFGADTANETTSDVDSESSAESATSDMDRSEGEPSSSPAETGPWQGQGEDNGLGVVCRPKVGDLIVGGGFLGIWKKTRVDAKVDGSWTSSHERKR